MVSRISSNSSRRLLNKRTRGSNLGFIIVAVAAMSCATLFGGAAALAVPPLHLHHPSPAAVVKHRSLSIGAVHHTSPTRSSRKHRDSVGSAKRPNPSQGLRQRWGRTSSSSALLLGKGDNENSNMPADGGDGGANMDPGLKLLICVLIDLVGVASFAAPGLGEATDVAWAPVSALLVNYLFGNGIFTALALVEELSPGFDVIPTATIAWFLENANREEGDAFRNPNAAPPPPPSPSTGATSQTKNRGKASGTLDVIDADIID